MAQTKWGALTPELVSDWINFDRDNQQWQYEAENAVSMAAKQAEGVAYLWNTLSLHKVAILADEVGMGKTFQALGVISLLWKMKPNAKVLVMAPNRDICLHWVREYYEFIDSHYRKIDHLVRNSADGGPVNNPHLCWNLRSLVDTLRSGKGNLFFTTIYALSGLVPQNEKEGDLGKKASNAAAKIHREIKSIVGVDGFDLIVVDEAHYFRNASGGSQRAHAAKALFGKNNNSLGQKTLLMTATPSHSGLTDVANILSYFSDVGDIKNSNDLVLLLKKYAIRRLRLMEGKDEGHFHNKHHYRQEIAVEADFVNNSESELFFALYQKKLVKELGQEKAGKKFLYGYLEGFESIGLQEDENKSEKEDETDSSEKGNNEFKKAPDSKILERLAKQYTDIFKLFPEHPKYGILVSDFIPNNLFYGCRDLHEDKNLVFVRRIPSVRELTQRVNLAYDHILIPKILEAWGLKSDDDRVKKWEKRSWSRAGFNELLEQLNIETDSEVIMNSEDVGSGDLDIDSSHLGSHVSALFVIKKEKGGATDCSNVSLRFRKPESLFSLFLEPASDYKGTCYSGYYKASEKEGARDIYSTAARDIRFSTYDVITQAVEGITHLEQNLTQYAEEMPTAWSLLYPLLVEEHQTIICEWLDRDKGIVENFGNYIKAGFLFASPVMVEIYCWFTEFNQAGNAGNVQDKYLGFIAFVRPKIRDSLLFSYFKNALETFEALCTKITDHKLHDWKLDWRTLKSLNNPAWYASGETGNRQRLILGFNSPFYPNVLVATSVFQEGVNLHLQCNKVHHYGIAWTPGDNEQRVGRVDRLFGKINQQLKSTGKSCLTINFPYLKNSFDEDQVGSFIKNKHSVEQKMDFCIPGEFDSAIDISSNSVNWKEYLRTPVEIDRIVNDPYPASFDSGHKPKEAYKFEAIGLDNIKKHLHGVFSSILNRSEENFYEVKANSHNKNALFLIDPIIKYENQLRHQPILVEQHFSAEFSSFVEGTVYYITLKTPIASKAILESKEGFNHKLNLASQIYKDLEDQYPLVKLAVNEDFSKSHFYCHMSVDLPIFVKAGQLSMLSIDEIKMAFEQLKYFADMFERLLFLENEQDLQKEELTIFKSASILSHTTKLCKAEHKTHNLDKEWLVLKHGYGKVAQLKNEVSTKEFRNVFPVKKFDHNNALHLLQLNSVYPFLKFSKSGNDLTALLNYPLVDFQKDEQQLLQSWFYYLCKSPT